MKSESRFLLVAFLTMIVLFIAVPSFAENTDSSTQAKAVFEEYGWTVKQELRREAYALPNTFAFSEVQDDVFYWAYVNEILAANGMDLSSYLGKEIVATMYETSKGKTYAVVLENDSTMIGLYLTKNSSLYSIDGRDFFDTTGKSVLQWLSEKGVTLANRFLEGSEDAKKTVELFFDAYTIRDWIVLPLLFSEDYLRKQMPSMSESFDITMLPARVYTTNMHLVKVISFEEYTYIGQPENHKYYEFFAEYNNDTGDGNLRMMIVDLVSTDEGWRVDAIVTGV